MINLRRDVLDDFAEAQQLARRDALVRSGGLSFATRRKPEHSLTKLEARFLSELRHDPRIARAARALCLGSRVGRRVAENLRCKRLIRLEHLRNKRRTLVARFVGKGRFE